MSTLGSSNSKTLVKIEGVTRDKIDILFLCDCRIKDKYHEISRMLGLNKNASYKLYANSDRDSRGVAIAAFTMRYRKFTGQKIRMLYYAK